MEENRKKNEEPTLSIELIGKLNDELANLRDIKNNIDRKVRDIVGNEEQQMQKDNYMTNLTTPPMIEEPITFVDKLTNTILEMNVLNKDIRCSLDKLDEFI